MGVRYFNDVGELTDEHGTPLRLRPMRQPPAPPELRPAMTTQGALALCEKCGDMTSCERSLYGLVWAEVEHVLAGCNGSMRLTSDGKEACAPRSPKTEPPACRIERG